MIAETGLCLADQSCHAREGGGMLTTSTALGNNLVDRIHAAKFMTFTIDG